MEGRCRRLQFRVALTMVVPASARHSDRVDDEELTYREAVRSLRETAGAVFDERLQSLDAVHKALNAAITTRLDAMDKAADVLSENVNRVPTLLDREAARLQALFNESTSHVRELISNRDDQAKQDKASAEGAADKALTSLKELIFLQNSSNAAAIAKSESGTADRLESLDKIISSTKDGITTELTNIKQRIDRNEGASNGQKELRREDHMNVGSIVGIIGGIVGLLALIIAGIGVYPHAVPSVSPTVGADTKRVDDLISRLDALSARMNSIQSLKPSPP